MSKAKQFVDQAQLDNTLTSSRLTSHVAPTFSRRQVLLAEQAWIEARAGRAPETSWKRAVQVDMDTALIFAQHSR
jgi:hypothetical protein